MALEQQIHPFSIWLASGLMLFLAATAGVAILGLLGAFLLFAVRQGPVEAGRRIRSTVGGAIIDILRLSPRRVLAMARLAFRESIRRYVLIVFVVFAVLLLFASWFLDPQTDDPARLYISVVLTSTRRLILLLAIFLSAFSLPTDLKNRTIYTVVTKPVRPWEIVLGRILGFTAIGTILLAMMCLASYIFVVRGLDHRHGVDRTAEREVATAEGEQVTEEYARTTRNQYHRHDIEFDQGDGSGSTEFGTATYERGHFHEVTRTAPGGQDEIQIGSPIGALQARVPVYGKLRYLDRAGKPTNKGINVGKEWSYRGYIEGGTLGTAIWKFSNVTPQRFPGGLPLEMTLRVFRTYKGEIERPILGTIILKHPNPDAIRQSDPDAPLESVPINFGVKEGGELRFIPRKIKGLAPDGSAREIDLFNDLVYDDQIEVWVRCAERAQYYGMAQADMYLRAKDRSFAANLGKAFFGMWLQLLVVTSFGVMFSTFLSGPVAMLATGVSLALGFFAQSIQGVKSGDLEGGGPLESMLRIFSQKNLSTPIDDQVGDLGTHVVRGLDSVVMFFMYVFSVIMPNFRDFAEYGGMSTGRFVASGFDIPANLVAQQTLTSLAYFLVVAALAYFFLKTREIAA